MIAFLMSTAGRYIIGVVLVISLVGGAYFKGRSNGINLIEQRVELERQKWEMVVKDAQSDHEKEIAALLAEYKVEYNKYQEEINKIKNQPPEIKEKIVRVYVSKKSDQIVPTGFVSLHNTAAKGKALLDTEAANIDLPSSKNLSDVGLVVAENYYSCNATRAQLTALQKVVIDFQRAQAELVK